MLESLILIFFICINKNIQLSIKLFAISLETIVITYIELYKWYYYLSIVNVDKVLVGINGEYRNKLIDILSSQSKHTYFLIGQNELRSESIKYISDSIYYYHISQKDALEIPIFLHKKFFSTPLSYKNYFSSSKGFYIYLVGKFDNNFNELAILDLPIGSAILLLGHLPSEKTFPLVYNEVQLSLFKIDRNNVYINFIHSIILSPFTAQLIIKTHDKSLLYESNNICPIFTQGYFNEFKVKQVSEFIEFFRSDIETSLSQNNVAYVFSKFIDENLSNNTAIAYYIDKFSNEKQYTTFMLFNFIASNAEESIQELFKANTFSINEMLLRKFTALHLAVTHSKLSIVKIMISMGADLEVINDSGYTALMIAVINRRYEVSKYFAKDLGACIKPDHIAHIDNTTLSNSFVGYACSEVQAGSIILHNNESFFNI